MSFKGRLAGGMFRSIVIFAVTSCALSTPQPPSAVPYLTGGRIVGGHDADIADYPYQLSLIYKSFGHFCGAALISPNWALTAAHCMLDITISELTVHAGSSYRKSDDGQIVNVSKIISHADFVYRTGDSDIALLQLASDVTIQNASTIPLASASPEASAVAVVTGWGITSENDTGLGADVLQVVQVPIVGRDDCQTAYSAKQEDITDTMVCAGYLGVGGRMPAPETQEDRLWWKAHSAGSFPGAVAVLNQHTLACTPTFFTSESGSEITAASKSPPSLIKVIL
ncbi:hypothetical protein NQ318_014933 [Aromia moschata]|uniref:Peptidase S1 domain-containing protein n=1 Tax=Aromia moschata TaxID=1265417 RepID=A0AAV8XJU8_9CUCU|nr:hypothetical protein NQ318_014933 [Aromia moschata]